MYKFNDIDIPHFNDYQQPIHVENRHFRTNNTNNYFELSSKEALDIPKTNGVIVSKEYVHFVDCPVCGTNKSDQLFVKWGFKIVSCPKCEHTYIENQINASKLEELYATSEVDKQFQGRKKEDEALNKYWVLLYAKYVQLLKEKGVSNSTLLDVGAGGGDFIALCDEIADYKLHAMEFSDNSAEYLLSIVGEGNLYRKEISNTDFKGTKFDVITMFGVLEHIDNPVKELIKCKEILVSDGQLLVLVPNLYSRAFKILGVSNPTINPRSHLNYFSKKSMNYLCDKIGFKIDEYYQELPVIDLMYDFIDYSTELVDDILDNNESYYSVYLLSHNH